MKTMVLHLHRRGVKSCYSHCTCEKRCMLWIQSLCHDEPSSQDHGPDQAWHEGPDMLTSHRIVTQDIPLPSSMDLHMSFDTQRVRRALQ